MLSTQQCFMGSPRAGLEAVVAAGLVLILVYQVWELGSVSAARLGLCSGTEPTSGLVQSQSCGCWGEEKQAGACWGERSDTRV